MYLNVHWWREYFYNNYLLVFIYYYELHNVTLSFFEINYNVTRLLQLFKKKIQYKFIL